jgi:hypothetical protein
MSAYLALALSVGVLAIIDTWLFFGPLAAILPGLVWISFIAWGCHYHSGGGVKGMTTAIVGMSFGALVGMAAVLLAGGAFAGLGEVFAISVAVGLGAFVICLASALPLLGVIPASVYGFASVAGPIALAGMSPTEAIGPTIGSIVIGALFGIVSEYLANALTKKDPAAAANAEPAA